MKWITHNAIWIAPLLLLLLLTPWSAEVDIETARWTYTHYWGIKHNDSSLHAFLDFLYDYGCWPAQIVFAAALLTFFVSWKTKKYLRLRGPCLMLVLSLSLGSGIISYAILKTWWGRPRPHQLVEFGGAQQFKPYYQPAISFPPKSLKSFPSGHATTGFYFFAIYFIGRRANNRWLKATGILLGLGFGGALSVARVMQGGHFVSDVFVAAIIMWLSAYLCDLLLYRYQFLWDYAYKTPK